MSKYFKGFLVLLLGLLVLVACGDETSDPEDNEVEDGVIELTFAAWGSPAEFKVYQRAIDAFNEEHDDIQVADVIEIPWSDYNQTLITRLQGGQAPDVFYMNNQNIANFIARNTLAPIDDFVESSDSYVSLDDFPEDIWGSAEQNGKKYGFSVDSNPTVMFYNKTVLDEVGAKTPQEYFDEGNWNWDAFEEITSQLVEAGKYGYVQDPTQGSMLNWIWSNGGEFAVDGEVVVDKDERTKEAFEYVNRMIENEYFVAGSTLPEGQGSDAMFMSNQIGLMSGGRWYAPVFIEANLDFDYIPWPTNTENDTEQTELATAFIAVNNDTEHTEAALKFASYYASERGQEPRLQGQNAVPSVLGLDHLVTENAETDHVEYLLQARDNGRVMDFSVSIPGLYDELNVIYELFVLGDLSVEETINELAEISEEMASEDK